jgi:hypothetical protein
MKTENCSWLWSQREAKQLPPSQTYNSNPHQRKHQNWASVESPRFPTPVVALRSHGLPMVSHPGWRVAQRAGASNGAVSGLCRAANKKLGWDTARGSNKPIQNSKSVGEWLSFEVWKRWHMIMMHVILSLQVIFCPVFKASIGVDLYIYCKPNMNTVNELHSFLHIVPLKNNPMSGMWGWTNTNPNRLIIPSPILIV